MSESWFGAAAKSFALAFSFLFCCVCFVFYFYSVEGKLAVLYTIGLMGPMRTVRFGVSLCMEPGEAALGWPSLPMAYGCGLLRCQGPPSLLVGPHLTSTSCEACSASPLVR